jgi:hypothetical protein
LSAAQAKATSGAGRGFFVELDGNFHAQRLIAQSRGQDQLAEFSAVKGAGKQELSAQEISATFAPQGWVTRAEATGRVSGESGNGAAHQTLQAQSALMEMVPGQNAPKLMVAKGGVDARTSTGAKGSASGEAADTRKLTTEELRLTFLEKRLEKSGTKGTKLASADTAGTGRIEWNEAANASTRPSQTILQANRLGMVFDADGKASRLDAKGNVHTERSTAQTDKQTATAKNGFVQLQEQGGWSRME